MSESTNFSNLINAELDALIKANDYAKSNSDNFSATERIELFNQHLNEGRDILLNQKLPGAFTKLDRFLSEKNYDEALKEVGRIVQLILKFVESVVVEGAEKFKVNDHLRKHGILESTPDKIMLRIKEEVKEIGKELEESIKKKDKEDIKKDLIKELSGGRSER